MRLNTRLVQQGGFMFRWRSFVPLALLPLAVLAAIEGATLEARLGSLWIDLWMLLCLLLSLAGLGLRIATIAFVPSGTSGRNTQQQRADHLNTTGLYSVVRNPLYLANFITLLGVVLALKCGWFLILFCLAYALYIERVIMAEENFLADKFGAAYESWAARTPAFFPAFRNWQQPALTLSFRMVLRREYNGFFAIILAFVALEMFLDLGIEGEALADWIAHDWVWPALFLFGLLTFLTLWVVKTQTTLLRVSER